MITDLGIELNIAGKKGRIIDTKVELTIGPNDKVELVLDFINKGILRSIYLNPIKKETDYNADLYCSKGILEYSSKNNKGICYDSLDIPYIDESGKITLKIENNKPEDLKFKFIRIRGLKI